MLEIRTRAFPRVGVIWFAEALDVPPLASVTTSRLDFLSISAQPSVELRGSTVSEVSTLLSDLRVEEEILWQGIQKKTRGYMRRAELEHRPTMTHLQDDPDRSIYRFLAAFRVQKKFPPIQERVYDEYLRSALISVCSVDGAPVVVHFHIVDERLRRLRLLWSARLLETALDTSSLNKLLHWRDLVHAKYELGMETYDWGGMSLADEALRGVDEFKQKFGGTLTVEYNVAWRSPLYARLKRLKTRLWGHGTGAGMRAAHPHG